MSIYTDVKFLVLYLIYGILPVAKCLKSGKIINFTDDFLTFSWHLCNGIAGHWRDPWQRFAMSAVVSQIPGNLSVLFNSLFRSTAKKTSSSSLLTLCEGGESLTFPTVWASNKESVPISQCHHVLHMAVVTWEINSQYWKLQIWKTAHTMMSMVDISVYCDGR